MSNITKQVITELESIKAIASELADMSPRTQMEIVALCKEICLNVDKVLEAHDLDITTLFNYIDIIDNQITELQNHDEVIDDRLEDLEASILTINESIGGINETLSTHTNQIQGLQNSKQDVLTAGENITIENNVISATGGGGGTAYFHSILMSGSVTASGSYPWKICLNVVSNNELFTIDTFFDLLINNPTCFIVANGIIQVGSNYRQTISLEARPETPITRLNLWTFANFVSWGAQVIEKENVTYFGDTIFEL